MKAVGFTGMPGSGKSEAMAMAKELGYPVVRMGDLIWEEVERQGLERIGANVGRVANAMREEHGPDIWALRTVERIRDVAADSPVVMVDGVRSNHEVDVFRRELGEEFTLVAIHTDQQHRFDRLTARARDDDPTDDDSHAERDQREMGWGIARTIALADEMLVNDGTLEAFHDQARTLLQRLAA